MNLIEGSESVWTVVDEEVQLYNDRQYENMYESTKFIIDCLSEVVSPQEELRVLDVGCSAGANLFHLAKHYENFQFTGIDINAHYLKQAEEKHKAAGIKNTNFKLLNYFNVYNRQKYDIIGSSQVLGVLDFDQAENFYRLCFQDAERAVFFQALFSDRELDYQITIHDYIYNKAVPHNIYSAFRLQRIAEENGFVLRINKNFDINIDLPNTHRGRGTYTIKNNLNQKMMFTDVLYLPWKFLYFERK